MNDTNINCVQISSCIQEELRSRGHSGGYYGNRLNGPDFSSSNSFVK